MFWTRRVTDIKRPFDVIFSPIMLSSLISNSDRITYCSKEWRGASERSGWYSPQRCWWQSVRAGRGNENGLKCLAPFHAALTSMTTLAASSLPPLFAFFRLKFALFVPRLLTLWVRGWESRGTDECRADFWESVTSHDAPLFFPTPHTHVRFMARFQHRYETTLGSLVAYLKNQV